RAMIAYCSRSIRGQGLADVVDVGLGQFGIDWQAQDLVRQLLGMWQRPTRELPIRRLHMRGQRVMDVGGDAVLGEVRLQRIALRRANHEQVEDAVFGW